MLRDLSLALKNPDGNFVVEQNFDATLTQRIPTINSEVLNRKKEEDEEEKKPKGKLGKYFKKHPKMKILFIMIIFIIVFVLSLGITYFVIELTTPKNVDVPDLTGLTVEQAESNLKDLKVNYKISSEE